MMSEEEIWKDVKGYEGLYQVSNLGKVKSLSRKIKEKNNRLRMINEKILKQAIDKNGYCKVTLSKNKERLIFSVHRLVATMFIPNKNNYPCVNHIDSNRQNNNVSNLEWCTHKENTQWAIKTGRFENARVVQRERTIKNKLGKNHIFANKATKRKVGQYSLDGKLIAIYESMTKASLETGIKVQSISYVCNNKSKTGGGYKWKFMT